MADRQLAWQEARLPTAQTRWSTVADLPDGTAMIDVRSKSEFDDGHLEGARHIFLGVLPEQLDALPAKDQPIALVCLTGDRSTVGASVLEQHGYTNVYNISGGMVALEE